MTRFATGVVLGLLVGSQRSSGMPCSSSTLVAPPSVSDTAGARQLAAAVSCSGGTFNISWVGSVVVDETIRVSGGTTLSIVGAPDGSSIVDGSGEVSLFDVSGGTLQLSDLALINGVGEYGGAISGNDSMLALTNCQLSGNTASNDGGAIFASDSSSITQEHCTLSDNTAGDDGGAIAVWTNSVLTAKNCTLSDNNAVDSGGAIYAITNSVLTAEQCTFSDNNADDSGGATWVGYSSVSTTENCIFSGNTAVNYGGAINVLINSELTAENCTLSGNYAGDDGGGINVWNNSMLISGHSTFSSNDGSAISVVFDSVLKSENCSFSGNVNTLGGGAIFADDNSMLIQEHCTFSDNNAGIDGGAIFVRASSTMTATNCIFFGNHADGFGGTIGVETGSNLTAEHCTFHGNSAGQDGGAIDGSTYAVLTVEHCTFSDNNAGDDGGAISTYENTLLIAEHCTFSGNHANRSGGAIDIAENDAEPNPLKIILKHCEFTGNSAVDDGGAIWAWQIVLLEIEHCTFSDNIAGDDGGAIHISTNTAMKVDGIAIFSNNTAGNHGGGVSSYASNLTVTGQTTITNNRASTGAGIRVAVGSSLNFSGDGVTISQNVASSGGGGISAEASTQFSMEGTRFSSNYAGTVGGAMLLLSVGTPLQEEETTPIPSVESEYVSAVDNRAKVSGCSFADNEARDAGGAAFVTGGFVIVNGSEFNGNAAGRAGGAVLTSGVTELWNCVFYDNHASLGPALSNTASVTLNNTAFNNNTLVCDDDNLFLDWKKNVSAYETACDACPSCATCFTNNPDMAYLCEPVLGNTASLHPNGTLESLDLAPGYWRSSSTSREIRECYETDSCVGGTEGFCDSGYHGPFCAVCADGYSRGLGYTCSKCNEGRRAWTIGAGVVLFLVAAVVVALSVKYLGSSADERAGEGIRSIWASQGVKIIIVSWQIVSQFSSVVSVTYPDVYETFVGYIDVLGLDLGWMLSVECWIDTDFYDTLLVKTIGPLVASVLVVMSYEFRIRKCRTEDQDRCSRIDHTHATFLYLISFLVYSASSSTIFETFACDDIDTGESFLRADHSIQCFTVEHRVYMVYAGFMCLVYPFGIPFCYAAILYQAREGLMSEEEAVRTNATALRALHAPYRKEVYYYEVVECFRRVTLSGLVVFILPNTAGQVITTFLLSFFYFALFMALHPYKQAWDTWLARVGHAIVTMSMFVALVVKVDTEGDDGFSQNVFAGALLFVNCALVLAVAVEAFAMCLVTFRKDITVPERVGPARVTNAGEGGAKPCEEGMPPPLG